MCPRIETLLTQTKAPAYQVRGEIAVDATSLTEEQTSCVIQADSLCSKMKLRQFLSLIFLFALSGHPARAEGPAAANADLRFALLADDFISGYLAWRPANGTALGLHEYDGKLTDLSRDSIRSELVR